MRPIIRLFIAALALLLVAGAAAWGYLRTTGLSALPEPGALETRLARTVRSYAIPAAVRNRQNPLPMTEETLAVGRAHFADHCASCHANDGSGNTEMGRKLFPKAPDMRAAATQQLTDGELFWVIENGIRFTGMPGWSTGTAEGETSSWQLVHFVRRLPRVTEAELEEMKGMNPRPPEEIRQEIEAERFLRGEDPPASSPSQPHVH